MSNNIQELNSLISNIRNSVSKATDLSRSLMVSAKAADDTVTVVQLNLYLRVLSAVMNGVSRLDKHKISPISIPSYVKNARDKTLWVEARRIAYSKNKTSDSDVEEIWRGLTRA